MAGIGTGWHVGGVPALDTHEQHLAKRRVERQQALLEILRTRAPRRTTATRLASELGVAVRTVERDLTRLRSGGIPLDVRPGAGGGVRFAVADSPTPVDLSPAEIGALLVALSATSPFGSAAAVNARSKLLDALADDQDG